jgi:hypothetical protein
MSRVLPGGGGVCAAAAARTFASETGLNSGLSELPEISAELSQVGRFRAAKQQGAAAVLELLQTGVESVFGVPAGF